MKFVRPAIASSLRTFPRALKLFHFLHITNQRSTKDKHITIRTGILNNLIHGEISIDGGEAQLGNNFTGILDGYFVQPGSGNLALTAQAVGAIDQADPLPEVPTDIRGRPRDGNVGLRRLGVRRRTVTTAPYVRGAPSSSQAVSSTSLW